MADDSGELEKVSTEYDRITENFRKYVIAEAASSNGNNGILTIFAKYIRTTPENKANVRKLVDSANEFHDTCISEIERYGLGGEPSEILLRLGDESFMKNVSEQKTDEATREHFNKLEKFNYTYF